MAYLSARTRFDPTPNRLTLALAAHRERGRPLLDLTISNPTRADLPTVGPDTLAALSSPEAAHYAPEPFGIWSARVAVAAVESARGVPVDPHRVILTASTSEAYSFLFKVLCDPGDDVVAPLPSYPLFEHLAAFEGVRLVPFRLLHEGAWHLDAGLAAQAIGPRSRAVLLVSPNNPTGSFVKRAELRAMMALGLPIICDEVFWPYALTDDPERICSAQEGAADGLVFTLGGLSKLAGLPQMKAGWIIVGGSDALAAPVLQRLELVADTYLSIGAPVQHALPALLAHRRPLQAAIIERSRRNLDRALQVFAESAVTALAPEGGWYLTLELPSVMDEEAWVLRLLAQGVWVQPGYFYDFAGGTRIVISLVTPEAIFAGGLSAIAECVVAAISGSS